MDVCKYGEIPSKNAKFFNALVHVNFYFDNISTTFKPTEKDYQQNLILYSGFPAIIGVVFFLIIGIYLVVHCCTLCCKRCKKSTPIARRRTNSKCSLCLAVFVWIAAAACLGSIIAGFVFNDGIDNGVNAVIKSVNNVTDTFDSIHGHVANIQNNILDIKENIDDLLNLSDLPSLAAEYLRDIKSSILEIIEELNGVKTVITPDISDDVKLVENYRWWASFGVLGLAIITCLFAVYSSYKQTRCGFFLALLIGSITLLLDWIIIGSHIGASMGMSDLCVDPIKTINFYLKTTSVSTKNIVNFYLKCYPHSIHPYEKYVRSSMELIDNAEKLLYDLKEEVELPSDVKQHVNHLTSDLNNIDISLKRVQMDLKCTRIKQEYEKAQCSLCYPVVGGLTSLLVSSFVLVVMLAIMLLLVAPLCKRVHKRKRQRSFMSSMLHGQSEETQYHSVTSDEESVPLLANPSPPPYEAIVGSVDFQFHSCQEPRVQRDPTAPPQEEVSEPNPPQHPQQDTVAVAAATNQHDIASSLPQGASYQQNNHFDRPPPRGEVVPVQKRVSMAF